MPENSPDVVSRVLRQRKKRMTPAVAKEVLDWRFSKSDLKHLGVLLEKNREGTITPAEGREMQRFVALGEMLDLLHLEAQVVLRRGKANQAA